MTRALPLSLTGQSSQITLNYGGIVVEVSAAERDMAWLRLLFARTAAPFKVLRDMGYVWHDTTERK